MRLATNRLLFVGYCVVAGDFLCLAPWLPGWARLLTHLPWPPLQTLVAHPLTRSAVTAFGVIHLVWSLHDVDQWAREREEAATQAAGSAPGGEPASQEEPAIR